MPQWQKDLQNDFLAGKTMHVQDLSQSTLATSGYSIQLHPRCGHMTKPKAERPTAPLAVQVPRTPLHAKFKSRLKTGRDWKRLEEATGHDVCSMLFLLLNHIFRDLHGVHRCFLHVYFVPLLFLTTDALYALHMHRGKSRSSQV